MHIRCWGSRGSIPVSGPEFNKYGGDTTCLEIHSSRGDTIIVDAGSGIRPLGYKLHKEKVKSILQLFTHVHYDHTIGFPFFSPAYSRSTHITICGLPYKNSSFKETLHGVIQPPYFPVDLSDFPARFTFKHIGRRSFSVGPVKISTIRLNHPDGGLGFRFDEKDSSFVFLTDNELSDERPGTLKFADFVDFCAGADLVIHDAEFNMQEYSLFKGYGHSTYTEVIDLGIAAAVKKTGLFHIHSHRTDKEMDEMVAKARKLIRNRRSTMQCFGVGNKFEIDL